MLVALPAEPVLSVGLAELVALPSELEKGPWLPDLQYTTWSDDSTFAREISTVPKATRKSCARLCVCQMAFWWMLCAARWTRVCDASV